MTGRDGIRLGTCLTCHQSTPGELCQEVKKRYPMLSTGIRKALSLLHGIPHSIPHRMGYLKGYLKGCWILHRMGYLKGYLKGYRIPNPIHILPLYLIPYTQYLIPLSVQKMKNRRKSPPQSLKTRTLLSNLLRVPAGSRKPLRFRRNLPRFLRRREKFRKKRRSPRPEYHSANWDATYRRWLERDIQNLKMGRDPNNIALHPENLPVNGRLPKSVLNDMHNEELQARAAAWDEAHPREEEFDEL